MSYYGYDDLDRLVSLRADALGLDAATYYSYDALGRRTALTDAEFHTTSFAYDALGRLLSEEDALGKTEYYAYDAAGNLVMLTNGDGQTAYYSFDAANRLTAIAFPDGAAPSFSYDAAGRLTSAYQSSPSYESDSFDYDPAGRVIARTNSAYGGTLYFQYDLAGRRTALADPKGGVVYYTYDQRGLITRVDASWGSTFYTFDARGALLTRHLPNNSCTYYTYDAAGRLSKLEDRWDDGAPIQTFEFARDPNGNITQSLREDGSCWYYDYDGLQRLTAADWKDAGGSTLYAFEYEYDKVGNRLRFAQNGVSTYYSYNEANELVSEVTPAVETAYYTYDGRGNQITRSVLAGHTTYFSYNSRNLVSGIWNTDPTFTPNYFTYNALGQRIKKVDSTGTTRYLWDGLNILLETDASGNLTRRYTHGYSPIEGVSSLIAVEGPIQCPCFYHFDQVGGVRHLSDPYHNTIKSYAYEPFGRLLAEDGSAPNCFVLPANTLTVRQVSRLGLSPGRAYDAYTGRWASKEPSRWPNQYPFGFSSPMRFVDTDGWGERDVERQMRWRQQLAQEVKAQQEEVERWLVEHGVSREEALRRSMNPWREYWTMSREPQPRTPVLRGATPLESLELHAGESQAGSSGLVVYPGFSGAVGLLQRGQLEQLVAAAASACRALREAVRHIEKPPSTAQTDNFCYDVLICQNKGGVLRILRKGISRTCDDRVEFDIEPDTTGRCLEHPHWDAYVLTRYSLAGIRIWRYSTIHVCVPRFFNRDPTNYQSTIIHEITHTGGAEDPPEDGGPLEDWRNAYHLETCITRAARWT